MEFVHNDGGRKEAGFKGKQAGDCVVRAIAIVAELPYKNVYNDLASALKEDTNCMISGHTSPRRGVPKKVYNQYLKQLGFTWHPTMHIGKGCTVHLNPKELPLGRIIVRLSRHLAAVIDGVLHDTYQCDRNENRCVYGYWRRE